MGDIAQEGLWLDVGGGTDAHQTAAEERRHRIREAEKLILEGVPVMNGDPVTLNFVNFHFNY